LNISPIFFILPPFDRIVESMDVALAASPIAIVFRWRYFCTKAG